MLSNYRSSLTHDLLVLRRSDRLVHAQATHDVGQHVVHRVGPTLSPCNASCEYTQTSTHTQTHTPVTRVYNERQSNEQKATSEVNKGTETKFELIWRKNRITNVPVCVHDECGAKKHTTTTNSSKQQQVRARACVKENNRGTNQYQPCHTLRYGTIGRP